MGLEDHGNSIRAGICDLDLCHCSWFDTWKIEQRYKSCFRKGFLRGSLALAKGQDQGQCQGQCQGQGQSRGRGRDQDIDQDQELDEEGQVHDLISNIGETVFENPEMGLKVTAWDAVHPSVCCFYRIFEVENGSDDPRNLRLFSNQNYNILENKIGETAVIDRDVLIHYKRDRYFLHGSRPRFDQFAVGTAGWRGLDGTWKDMEEDGALSGNVVAHGSVDSTLGWTIPGLLPGEARRVHLWIVLGKRYHGVMKIHRGMKRAGKANVYRIAFNFWNSFVEKIALLPLHAKMHLLPEKVRKIFYRSLIATVAHMDMNGSVIASCDSEIRQFGADLYTYCWPRDAAWACIALDRARYHHLSSETFEFFSKVITERGYFLHKYTPAGDFGSTWHPIPMIQIDETGLPLYAVYHNWLMSRDVWTTGRYFGSLVAPAANWLSDFLDEETRLPIPSFDLWEERKGVHTYSACTVYAGLHGASELARLLGNDDEFERWSDAAESLKSAVVEHLYDPRLSRFGRSLDDTGIDSSLFAVWYFGILPPNDRRVTNTMQTIERELLRPSGGVSRYRGDSYQGYMNAWIICTLWLAQWHAAIGELDRSLELISWCANLAHPTGHMPEQVADGGSFRSVLPLMWSHSAYVLAVLEHLEALGRENAPEPKERSRLG